MAKNNKKKIKNSKSSKIISALVLILSIIMFFLILNLNVIPDKYILILTVILLIANLILFLLLKFTNSKFLKFISILLCGGLFYGIISLSNTESLLTNMNIDYKTNNYVVVVKKDKDYNEIRDLENKRIGYFDNDKAILEKLPIKYQEFQQNDITLLANDLLNDNVDGLVIEKSYIEMLSDSESGVDNFEDKIKIIYEFSINTKVVDISKDVDTTSEMFCIYLSGVDTYGNISSVSRTDANLVLFINPTSKQILMISIPRDYYIALNGKNGKDKLTHSGIYGIDTTIKSVENLLDIDINYYYKINFTSLIELVDSVGGVDVYSKYTFTSKDGYNYKEGYNHVNGKQALSFVRERKAFSAGDRIRNMNQQALVEALLRKCTSSKILTKYNSLLNSLKDSFVTNMNSERLTSLIKMQLNENSKWNITTYSLDGSNAKEYTYSYKSNKLYVMLPNQDTIKKAQDLISKVKKGDVLDSSYNSKVDKINTVTKQKKQKLEIKSNSNLNSNLNSNSTSNEVINSNSNPSMNDTNINEDTSAYYTVIYEIDGIEESIKIKEGEVLTPKDIPEKEGYNKLGWYLGDNMFDFSMPISDNIKLIAKYEQIVEKEELEKNLLPIEKDINLQE